MKIHGYCEDCGHKHQFRKLRESQVNHRKICYNCYRKENKNEELAKLSDMDRDNYFIYKSQKKKKKNGRILNLLKNGISLIRGEDKVLEKL